MIFKCAFVWSLFFVSAIAFADNIVPPICEIGPQSADQVIPSDAVSGDYWTNMMGNDIVLFTNTGGTSGRFQGFDLKNKVPIRLTTDIDPFPAPDGRHIYVHPSPPKFYNFDEVRAKIAGGARPSEIQANYQDEDRNISGYYESLAALETKKTKIDNHSTYRFLSGEGEGSIKDYRVDFGDQGELKSVKPLGKATRLCPNLRGDAGTRDEETLDFDTPIISPKGDEFAVTSRRSNSTVILKFNPTSGNCTKTLDLGFEAGKVHFSPDGTKIAFSSLNFSNSRTLKPYVYDRKTKELKSLEVGDPQDDAQGTFPTFMPNGKILYQRVKLNRANGHTVKDWVIVDPDKMRSAKLVEKDATSCAPLAMDKSIQKLENLWTATCANINGVKNGFLWRMTVTPAACKDFVKNASPAGGVEDKNILSSACPNKNAKHKAGAQFSNHGVVQAYPRILEARCTVCHVPGSPHGYIPFDNPDEMRKMKAMGSSSKPGAPFFGKTFAEQVASILDQNTEGKTPGPGVPRVPADGSRLTSSESTEILEWVKNGKTGKYIAPANASQGRGHYQ